MYQSAMMSRATWLAWRYLVLVRRRVLGAEGEEAEESKEGASVEVVLLTSASRDALQGAGAESRPLADPHKARAAAFTSTMQGFQEATKDGDRLAHLTVLCPAHVARSSHEWRC